MALATYLLDDVLAASVYDRFEGGEHRYHLIGSVGSECLLLVYTYPDPVDENRIRAISLREASPHERRRYEEEDLD